MTTCAHCHKKDKEKKFSVAFWVSKIPPAENPEKLHAECVDEFIKTRYPEAYQNLETEETLKSRAVLETGQILQFFVAMVTPIFNLGVPARSIRGALEQLVHKDEFWEAFEKILQQGPKLGKVMVEASGVDISRLTGGPKSSGGGIQ